MKLFKIFFFLAFYTRAYGQLEQLINAISVENHTITYYLTKDFHATFLRDNLFVTYQDDIDLTQLDYTIITMPLIMNIISMIWVSGKDYYIHALDKDLYYSLETVHETFKRFYPRTKWDGRLIPGMLVDNNKKNLPSKELHQIALPFSNGLDSLCTSLKYHDVRQLLITVRGCPDTPLDFLDANWHITQKTISHFANIHGHATSFIHSNFHEFFNWDVLNEISHEITNWRMDTIEDLGWIGLAAPIVCAKGIQKLVLASNEDWSMLHPGASCPLVIDTVSFRGVSITCDAFDIPRPLKNKTIATICNKHGFEKPHIFVCEHTLPKRKNCGKCQKCTITILSFLLAHEDPQLYGFNIDRSTFLTYFKHKYFYRNLYSPHRACWFKYAQHIARTKLGTFDQELNDFLMWYITIDFDKLTLPNPQIDINYDHFKDLWGGIPDNWHEARLLIQKTHSPGKITDKEYAQVWQNVNV